MIIFSAARSSPQPLDLCLLIPTTSAYSAMRSVPDSHLINAQGNRLSCRDQEGRRGSEEAVPGPSVFPRDPVEVAGPLGTPLGLAQRKRAQAQIAWLSRRLSWG